MCAPKNIISNAGKAVGAIATGGTSLIPGSPTKKVGDFVGNTLTGGLSGQKGLFPSYGTNSNGPAMVGGAENPAQTLAQSGGAPLLANIAMGAGVEQALAGYFGKSNYNDFYNSLGEDDKQLVDGVKNQLTSIQKNTDLRNQAVQQVVNDFPNIAAEAAKAQTTAKKTAGEEFDSTTKGYIDQALNGVAAKYAANGMLSSGAMAAASARTGADIGMQKLGYVTDQGNTAYDRTNNAGLGAWQARYNETNALRNFQNLMTQGAAGNGFSAVQASLGRTQQTNMANAGFQNQQNMQNQQNDNAMFGAIGGLAGTVIGGAMGGPMGAGIGGSVGKMATNSGTGYGAPVSSNNVGWRPAGNPRLNIGGY